tara:strand:- start:2896 stop:3414 length:519 start_codon:yes stop_codon:yes gene_type:complete
MGWDTRKDQILRDHYGKGLKTASEIARFIGDGITRNSVIGRASRLGLSGNIKVKKKLNDTFHDQNNTNLHKRGKRSKFVLNKDILDKLGPAKLLTLEELTENTCKYMINEDQKKEGHPDMPGSFFCGRDTVDKYSYCIYHMGLVWTPKVKKEQVINKEDEVPEFIEKKVKSA